MMDPFPEEGTIVNQGSWEVSLSSDEDEETLMHPTCPNVDDEDIAQAK